MHLYSPRTPNYIWDKPNLLTNASFCSDSSKYAIFSQSLMIADFFFTSAIGPDILIKVVTFLVWAACVLFNFYIKQKQKFSVWSFTENATFISFHEGIWSVTKAHWKKCRSRLGNFKHNKVACFTGYSL